MYTAKNLCPESGVSQAPRRISPAAPLKAKPTTLCQRNLLIQHRWTCPPPHLFCSQHVPCSPVDVQLSLGAQHTHGVGGLLWGHMDHSPLGHSPASLSLQLQEAPGLVPSYHPTEPVSQHLRSAAQLLSPSPLRSRGACPRRPSSALQPLGPCRCVDARSRGRVALSVSWEGPRAQGA